MTAASGNFFTDPLPAAEVITMGMILHDWNLEQKLHLIQAAYDALPPGGVFICIEPLIDDARRSDAFALSMSLNMLIEFGDAFGFTGRRLHRLVHARRVRAGRRPAPGRTHDRRDRLQGERSMSERTSPRDHLEVDQRGDRFPVSPRGGRGRGGRRSRRQAGDRSRVGVRPVA